MKGANYNALKTIALQQGADLFGVADTGRLEKYIHDELKLAASRLPFTVSIAIRLQKAVLDTLVNRPNQIYKTHYRQVNSTLDHVTQELARFIQSQKFHAIPIAASYIIDWQKQDAHISHRHAALEAGLGFWGRNNLLVHPQYGAGIRLSSLLTDMPLSADSPIPNDCGECIACMEACPADAISEDGFNFDKCYAQVTAFSRQNNYNLHICGLCVKACANARG